MMLTSEQQQALHMLSDAPRGHAESVMASHFGVDLLAGLVRRGLVSVAQERVRANWQWIEVVMMRITDAGRQALDG
jgi:hypothetical protein